MASIKYRPLPELDEIGKAKFWSKVASGAPNECWPWTGGMFVKDYGCFPVERRSYYAHRFALALSSGVDPVGLVVCHRCDNPKCCNPSHLFAGTHKDNTQDMLSKGRGPTAQQRWESRARWRETIQANRLRKQEERQRLLNTAPGHILSRETIDYLLGLAMQEKEAAAQAMIASGTETSPEYGKAAAAVKELLEERNPYAELGRKGGSARRPTKGMGSATPEQRAERAAKMVAARRAKSISRVPSGAAVVAE